ncbi:MAG: sensor histidine kinase [Betaproteobacteria bacterium]|nr:sensor histidine kinase [Betaproteobacteria bacterium]
MPEADSLRSRLFARLIVPLIVLVVLSAGLAYYAAFRFANQVYDHWISDTAVALSQLTREGPAGIYVDLPSAAQHMLASDQRDNTYYRIAEVPGRFIAGHRALPHPPAALVPGAPPVCYDGIFGGDRVRVSAYRPRDMPIVVQVAETVTKRDTLALEIIAGMLLPLLLLALLGTAGIWFGVDAGLLPLTRLARQLHARTPQDLRPLEESAAPSEVRPLVHALNGLLGRVDEMLTAQRRFVGDAAHQLRTPIAGLKTQAEMALRAEDPATLKAVLANIVAGTSRAASLVSQLLALARSESPQGGSSTLQPVDLDQLARSVTSDWISRALEAEIDLGYEPPERRVRISGDPVMLREVLGNLIDNALKYCPRGGEATVRLVADAATATLTVTDNGPGIPPAERERVFERFYRVADSTISGTGLGLAIVREFALAQGGSARVEPGPDGRGTSVIVTFPTLP